jgi:hypothetical protein
MKKTLFMKGDHGFFFFFLIFFAYALFVFKHIWFFFFFFHILSYCQIGDETYFVVVGVETNVIFCMYLFINFIQNVDFSSNCAILHPNL